MNGKAIVAALGLTTLAVMLAPVAAADNPSYEVCGTNSGLTKYTGTSPFPPIFIQQLSSKEYILHKYEQGTSNTYVDRWFHVFCRI